MDIQDLEQLDLLSQFHHIWGRGETIAVGQVETGDGYASAGAYAGALGNNATTHAQVRTRTRQGRWSRLSRADSRAEARAGHSDSSYSGRSTYFGFEGGFLQISSEKSFDVG